MFCRYPFDLFSAWKSSLEHIQFIYQAVEDPRGVFEENQRYRRAPLMVRVDKMFEEMQSKLPYNEPKFLLCLFPEWKSCDIYGLCLYTFKILNFPVKIALILGYYGELSYTLKALGSVKTFLSLDMLHNAWLQLKLMINILLSCCWRSMQRLVGVWFLSCDPYRKITCIFQLCIPLRTSLTLYNDETFFL